MNRTAVGIALASSFTALAGFVLLLQHATPAAIPPPAAPPPVTLPPPSPGETAREILERKRLFVALLLPVIQAENARLLTDRRRIARIEQELSHDDEISRDDFDWLKQLAEHYELDPKARRNSEFFESLRQRVDRVPASLIIAQAALESGWGRSEVTRESHNYFGHYCFDKGCGVAAPGAGDLRRFDSVEASVQAYMHNLNSHPAYHGLRAHRAELRARGRRPAGSELAGDLTAYSERGAAYVADVRGIIHGNDFDALADTP